MRVVIQRVRHGRVDIDGECVGKIDAGIVALVGIAVGDEQAQVRTLAEKVCQLRIFPGDGGPFDRSLIDIGGQMLVVSQFTLMGDTRKGRRPSWIHAARPENAEPLVDLFAEVVRAQGVEVATGVFGADMQVDFVNDGPVTLVMEA